MSGPTITFTPATFLDLTRIEPRLRALKGAAQDYRQFSQDAPPDTVICANARWYGYLEWEGNGLKDLLNDLVGWDAENPVLRSSKCYDVAYHHVYRLLPDCRNCTCTEAQS